MGLLQKITFGQSPLVVFAGLGALLVAFLAFRVHQYNALVDRLGRRAPARKSKWPLGLDFIYESIRRTLKYEDLQFFSELLNMGHPDRPWTVEIPVLGKRFIFTADEENIKAILATQFQDYGKGPEFNRQWHDLLGDSIFTTDGKQWHDSRSLIRPQFVKDRVSDLAIFEANLQIMLPKFSPAAGTPVDAMDLFYRYTLDSATHFLLGKSTGSLHAGKSRFAEAFSYVQSIQAILARSGPVWWMVPRRKFHSELRVIDEFLSTFIDQTLSMTPQEVEECGKSDKGYTFLHALAAFTRDRAVLRDQLISVLLAARDTTAVSLSWLFYTLSKHPEVMAKLRAEIYERLGRDRLPSYEDLKAMKYLQYTLNEILRLYPPVPFNVRIALKDTTLPVGGGEDGLQPVGVPAGTPIGYSTQVLQHRADVYPPVSDKFAPHMEFSPDRWFHWTPKSWTYVPFNGGPRICVGQQFALTELAYTVVRILQSYARIENRMTEVPLERAEIVVAPSVPITLAFYKD